MPELAARLAQEGWDLAQIELRRLGAEVRLRQKYAGRAAVALLLGGTFTAAATGALATAMLLYLGQRWGSYAAGALATGVLLLLMAVASACVLMVSARGFGHSTSSGKTTAGRQDERHERSAGP